MIAYFLKDVECNSSMIRINQKSKNKRTGPCKWEILRAGLQNILNHLLLSFFPLLF